MKTGAMTKHRTNPTDTTVKQVMIIGGGTAGWITAGLLASKLNSKDNGSLQITLVESPTIPILGVGEGTWPTIRTTLQSIGVDENEFIRQCDATFKQGSEFVNWVHPPEQRGRHSYFHPLSAVFHAAYDFNLAPYWVLEQERLGQYDRVVSSQAHICEQGLAPKKITTPAYAAIQNYSYHLDANKFARFMHEFCVAELGVEYVSANVTGVELDKQGYVTSVETDLAGRLHADFFVDCSGSKGLLIGDALGVAWHDISDTIFNDTAMAMQVPYQSPDDPIATHTIATAQPEGWTWDIGLSERRGVGFVYSSSYTGDDRAEKTLRDYVGSAADALECRKIRFRSGYREKFWSRNCLAIGMSAAFIEPLEASAIFLVEAAANMLVEQFPRTRDDMAYCENQYNSIFHLRWDKTVDFVKLHYCISKRRDTDYWTDNCREETIPEGLRDKLNYWKRHVPSKYDFDYAFEPFVLVSYLFVLYGMEYDVDLSGSRGFFGQQSQAETKFNEIQRSVAFLSGELPTQRKLVQQVHEHGFASI